MKEWIRKIRQRLSRLSFRTGVMVLALCALCYAVSFAQMALPIPVVAKGVLWTLFFGLAKTFQYSALLILGKAGVSRLRSRFRRKPDVTDADGVPDRTDSGESR